ncbi:NAD(P) transhydrogenase subunit alpha domain-containing protein (plasmid) [Rhizobium etli bv. mimosae str. IE4771]|uniref:NAD(P) transhydrogenase subunit alpha domain-containing protein n=1 Tax=Rhizobium etli bv. mimosae str. IE4771 TaxID=1432050 RepID=A0A060ID46_RHIET|nr:NAD(P) transhydrogenase subunit alpha domain-containing protein [Rhizobium sp. IE4771]
MAEGAHFLTKQGWFGGSSANVIAMEMEALSSMANIADYRAVIKAGANIGLLHRADHRSGQGVWKRPESL